MKNVLFIRHAKSSWDDPSLTDLERPLNTRGLHDAPKMAKYVKENFELSPVAIVSSIAKRARQTAKYFAREFQIEKEQICLDEQLYFGNANDYLHVLRNIPESITSCLIFGHNPIIEHLASMLANPYNGPAPTCSVFVCEAPKKEWKDLQARDIQIIKHLYPKMINE
ncbi:MAG: histidine phosphatase family protein [Saprospiraceae bacterium]|nr:histidine phosphatase family protein [Saprospiraceae bacterium]